ncbi:MAG: GPW/gp25 family protein [Verrucomicrobiota bacterium]
MSKRFLGRGWGFPIDVGPDLRVPYVGEEEKIQQSALIILGTARGERVMRPDFGSRLHELVFAPMNSGTKALVAHYATDALVTWEPRIDVLRVTSDEDPGARGKLLVNVEYRVRSTNSVFNLVYPFYLKGGKS